MLYQRQVGRCRFEAHRRREQSGDRRNPRHDPVSGRRETHRAIDAANAAWPAWRKKTAKERANILRKWFNLMMENQDDWPC